MTLQQGQQPQHAPRPTPHPVIVEGEARRQQDAIRYGLYTAANTPQMEYAYRLWLQQFTLTDNVENYHRFIEAVVTDEGNRHYVQSIRELPDQAVLAYLGVASWPPPGMQLSRPTAPPPRFTPPVAQAATQSITMPPVEPKPLRKNIKSVKTQAVGFDLVDFFDTEYGQWVMLGLFVLLTIVDWATNIWMLTGEEDLGTAIRTATIWHWLLGLLLVWTEMYFAMAKALFRRSVKVDGLQRWLLLAMLGIAVLAVVYDLLATFIPPFNLIAKSGDAFSIIGGIIVGALLAVVTTVGSSKVVEQAIVCFQLRKQPAA